MTGTETTLLIVVAYLVGALAILAWHARVSLRDLGALVAWPVLIAVAVARLTIAFLRQHRTKESA